MRELRALASERASTPDKRNKAGHKLICGGRDE
jgi:hypothetical protein